MALDGISRSAEDFEVKIGPKPTVVQKGSSLIEMMIAMLVLTVGLLGSMALAAVAINTDTRARKDSTSAALAAMVEGQIAATPIGGSVSSVAVSDCAGHAWTINTSGTTSGAGANLTSSGSVDYTQTLGSVTGGYAMNYTVCAVNTGMQSQYDVRWNVKTLPSNKEEFVVVAAQYLGSNNSPAQVSAAPVNLRTVVGNIGN